MLVNAAADPEEPVRLAAIRAIGNTASGSNLGMVVALLAKAKSPKKWQRLKRRSEPPARGLQTASHWPKPWRRCFRRPATTPGWRSSAFARIGGTRAME